MNKRWIVLLLLMVMLCMIRIEGFADEITLTVDGKITYIASCAVADEKTWLLCNTTKGYQLLKCEKEETAFSLIPDIMEAFDEQQALFLATDGTVLKLISVDERVIYTVEQTASGCEVVQKIAFENNSFFTTFEDGERFTAVPHDAVLLGDTVYCLFKDYSKGYKETAIVTINTLTGQTLALDAAGIESLSVFNDHSLLVLRETQDEGADLMVYDIQGQSLKMLAGEIGYEIDRVRYWPKAQLAVWQDQRKLMGFSEAHGTQQIGYSTLRYNESIEVIEDNLISITGYTVNRFNLSTQFRTDETLTIYGSGNTDMAVQNLREQYPSLQVYYLADSERDTVQAMIDRIVSADESIDVFTMTVDGSPFVQMKEKGYCLDLSNVNNLQAAISQMHPTIIETVTKAGALYAIPIEILSFGWYINTDVMDGMGLTIDELPSTIEELCAFITKWNDEWIDAYPEYTPIEDWNDLKGQMLRHIVSQYMRICQSNHTSVDFTSNAFHSLLTAYENMAIDNIEWLISDNGDRRGLFIADKQVVGQFKTLDTSKETQFVPMQLTRDMPFTIDAQLTVMFINPASTNLALATQLLEYAIKALPQKQQYCLYTGRTEPIEDPEYAAALEAIYTERERLSTALSKTDDAGDIDMKEQLRWLQLREEALSQYFISPEELAFYKLQIEPYIHIAQSDMALRLDENDASAFSQSISQYLYGSINGEQLISQMNRIVQMVTLENK